MRRAAGFTLIELLVVMVIVAILASIAIPAYSRYIQRGDLVEATQALSQYRVQMEQWFQDNNTYAAAGGGCGVVPPGNPPLVNFAVACALGAGGTSYLATATGLNSSVVKGFSYTIDQANNQATTGLGNWTSTLPSNAGTAWITK